jgi:hypothetical protein
MLTTSGYSSDAFEKGGADGQLVVDDSLSRIGHRHSRTGWQKESVGFAQEGARRFESSQAVLAEHAEEQASERTGIQTTVNRPVETA